MAGDERLRAAVLAHAREHHDAELDATRAERGDDFVGKLERFPGDLFLALKKIARAYAKFVSAEQQHATQANNLLHQYYTERTRSMVFKKFEIDFDHFQYSAKL